MIQGASTPPRNTHRPFGASGELAVAALASGLTALLWLAGWLAPLDRISGDSLLRLTNRHPIETPVTAVVIDDRSTEAVGPLPWPRATLAELVTSARDAGAAAVVVDLLLFEAGDGDGDAELAGALQRGPSLLAAALGRDGRWLLPLPIFGGAELAAHVHAEVGADGVARTLAATKQGEGLSLPAISLAAARVVRPDIPVEPGALLRPDFRPAPDRVARMAAADLLSSPDRGRWAAGKLVFVGVTATGSGDRLVVPTTTGPAPSPGVLVHASATASILRGGLIRSPGPAAVLGGVFLAALAIQLVRTRSGAFHPWTLIAAVIAVAGISALALEVRHLLVPVAPVVTSILASVILREGVESRVAQRESGRLLSSLLRHHGVDPAPPPPRSPADRLTALRDLQKAVLRDHAARRTLLDEMHDGVVMWDADGRTVVVNPAAARLWGDEPHRSDFDGVARNRGAVDAVDIRRNGREIAVTTHAVGNGGMALLRDVTADRELERKRRDMQRLVSHELKTPLASIAGLGETLQRYQLEPDEQQRVASLIRGESLRLGEMVSTFLDLERLGSGRTTDSADVVDLSMLVDQRLEILAETARSRGQRIEHVVDREVSASGAAPMLARVVDNLVGNALKFSPVGATVEVRLLRDADDAVLTVADHGMGIPDEVLPRIFERFYRAPGLREAGSGLGLALAHEVVTWHGGCISVDSAVGRGSTFTVRLPAGG